VLHWRLSLQPRMDVLRIDRFLESRQFAAQIARPVKTLLQERLLKPAIEVLDAAVELRFAFRR
jgi:hypothetical protein